jgi:hypothetical protein
MARPLLDTFIQRRTAPCGPAGAPGRRRPSPAPAPAAAAGQAGCRAEPDERARIRGPDAREPCRRGGGPGAVPRPGHVRPRSEVREFMLTPRAKRPITSPGARPGSRNWAAAQRAQPALVRRLIRHRRPGRICSATSKSTVRSGDERQVEGHLKSISSVCQLGRSAQPRHCRSDVVTTRWASAAGEKRRRAAAGPGARMMRRTAG